MVGVAAIAGLVSSLKAAGEITKAMIGLRDAAVLQNKVIELQAVILAAQSDALAAQGDQFSLLERVRGLERDIAALEAWDAEKERYALTDIGHGAFAYVIKPDARGSEPDHKLCANCYQEGHKSILQPEIVNPGMWRVLVCHRCGSTLWPNGGGRQSIPPPPVKKSGGTWGRR